MGISQTVNPLAERMKPLHGLRGSGRFSRYNKLTSNRDGNIANPKPSSLDPKP